MKIFISNIKLVFEILAENQKISKRIAWREYRSNANALNQWIRLNKLYKLMGAFVLNSKRSSFDNGLCTKNTPDCICFSTILFSALSSALRRMSTGGATFQPVPKKKKFFATTESSRHSHSAGTLY